MMTVFDTHEMHTECAHRQSLHRAETVLAVQLASSSYPTHAQEKRKEEKAKKRAGKAAASNAGTQPQIGSLTMHAFLQSDVSGLLEWLCHQDVIPTQKDRLCTCSGPESPPESDSEASDHGPRAEGGQQAGPRKPSVEREDWMTKAMPKSAPGADSEAAGAAKDEPVKEVVHVSLWKAKSEQSPHPATGLCLWPIYHLAHQGRCSFQSAYADRVLRTDTSSLYLVEICLHSWHQSRRAQSWALYIFWQQRACPEEVQQESALCGNVIYRRPGWSGQPSGQRSEMHDAMQAEELNPYMRDGGDGYPDKESLRKAGHSGIIPTAKVGDGGASWRLKALKRAQTAAEDEGRSVNEIVSERFNSLRDLTASLSDRRAAHCEALCLSLPWHYDVPVHHMTYL